MSMDLKDKTLDELERIVLDLGGKKYLGAYIFQFIHVEGAADISQITPLSKALREQLSARGYYVSHLTVADKQTETLGTVLAGDYILVLRYAPGPCNKRLFADACVASSSVFRIRAPVQYAVETGP